MKTEEVKDWKTGYPPPVLMQDDDRKLSIWFATRLGAREVLRRKVYNIGST